MPLFDSRTRKLVVFPASVFIIGWSVYLAGFKWLKESELQQDSNHSSSSSTPSHLILIGGPIICLIGVVHAALPGLASLVVGAISAFVSTVYFVCAGDVAYESGLNISETMTHNNNNNHPRPPVSLAATFMLTGTLIQSVSWLFVMILTVFYEYYHTNDNTNRPQPNSSSRLHISFIPGLARKISVPLIILSAIGWCILASQLRIEPFIPDGISLFAPLLYLAALLHAGCSRCSTRAMVAVLTFILTMVFVMSTGAIFISQLKAIHCHKTSKQCHNMKCVHILLSGSFISLFFWSCVLTLWPFYHRHPLGESNAQQQQQQQQLWAATGERLPTVQQYGSF